MWYFWYILNWVHLSIQMCTGGGEQWATAGGGDPLLCVVFCGEVVGLWVCGSASTTVLKWSSISCGHSSTCECVISISSKLLPEIADKNFSFIFLYPSVRCWRAVACVGCLLCQLNFIALIPLASYLFTMLHPLVQDNITTQRNILSGLSHLKFNLLNQDYISIKIIFFHRHLTIPHHIKKQLMGWQTRKKKLYFNTLHFIYKLRCVCLSSKFPVSHA